MNTYTRNSAVLAASSNRLREGNLEERQSNAIQLVLMLHPGVCKGSGMEIFIDNLRMEI